MIFVRHAFNSHVYINTKSPYINRAFHVLLIYGFSTLSALIPGQKHILKEFVGDENSFTKAENKDQLCRGILGTQSA